VDKITNSNEQSSDQARDSTQDIAKEVVLDSVALARLLDEVRNDTTFNPAAYNRTYNRHNR
jgi:hypothetical protein